MTFTFLVVGSGLGGCGVAFLALSRCRRRCVSKGRGCIGAAAPPAAGNGHAGKNPGAMPGNGHGANGGHLRTKTPDIYLRT